MEPENGKTESVNENENKEIKNVDEFKKIRFPTNKYEDHFFQRSLYHIINLLLTKLVRSRWLDIGLVLFLRFYGPRLQAHLQDNHFGHDTPKFWLLKFKFKLNGIHVTP